MKKIKYLILFITVLITNSAYTQNCLADFYYSVDSASNTYSFFDNSTADFQTICNYYWDFGDGANSNLQNPEHSYNSAGDYQVCLIIETSTDSCANINCVDSTCKTITVLNNNNISISGNVYAKTALLPEGIAILNKVENTNYTAISYTNINNGYYQFNNLDIGNYIVYSIPYFGDLENYYPLYYPTYSGNTEHYSNADIIYADTIINKDINLKYNEDINHGFGYISGKIVYNYGSNFETNIYNQNWFNSAKSTYEGEAQNVTVLLYNDLAQVIRYTLSNENGDFEFKDIPYGLNTIYTEKAGKQTEVINTSLDNKNDTIKDILIHIKETEILNISETSNIEASVYPNPFNDYLNIKLNKNLNEISVFIYNITGKQVFYSKFTDKNIKNYRIKTDFLKKGTYILLIKSGDTAIIRKKLIK